MYLLYRKTVTSENDASSEITNVQKDLDLFLKSNFEDEGSQFYFLYHRSKYLSSVTPISEIKSEKVFDRILGKCFF